MGGYGSGRYLRLTAKNSRRVNQFSTMDIRQLQRQMRLVTGEPRQAEFQYAVKGGAPVFASPRIVWTAQHYGLRPFFECPHCRRRCCLLYLAERCACRQCLRLAYPVQFETKLDQAFRRAWKARLKLVDRDQRGRHGIGDPIQHWQKPKGMRWKTFYQLRVKADKLAQQAWDIIDKENPIEFKLLRE